MRRRSTTVARAAVALALGAVLAGCGTTVPMSRQVAAGSGLGGPSAAADGLTATTGGTGASGSGGAVSTGAVSGSSGAVPAAGSSGGGATGTTGAGLPTAGGGTAAQPPIEIGTYYLNGGNAALASAGFGGLVIPDSKPVFDAFVRYLNAHGGLAGRRIEPVYYEYNEGGDPHGQDAAACSTFTQDHHVFLVLGGINSGAGDLLPCLAQHNVPLVSAATGGDQQFFARYHRYAYEPGQLNFTAGLELLVADLQSQGYLAGVHKVGVVQYPGTIYDNAVNQGLVPALSRVGLKLDDRVTTSSNTDNGAIATASTSAVLKFKTDGIDLVLFMTPGGAAETYFMQGANQQGYSPKYGIWSADSPTILATTAPHAQLAKAKGVGYLPGLDVATGQDPTATTPQAKKCLALGKSMGLDESGLGNPLIRTMCDVMAVLLGAIDGNPAVTRDTALFEKGVDALGASIAPASTFAMRWTPGHHDAVDGFRRLTFDQGCGCFAYTGSTRRIPRP